MLIRLLGVGDTDPPGFSLQICAKLEQFSYNIDERDREMQPVSDIMQEDGEVCSSFVSSHPKKQSKWMLGPWLCLQFNVL